MIDAEYLSEQRQWDDYLRGDDSVRIGAALARDLPRAKDKARAAKYALELWEPCPRRLELPN